MSELRQQYLDKKYENHDDEQDVKYKKSSRSKAPKKSKHKHHYENCVLLYNGNKKFFSLIGVCSECRKIGPVQKDVRIERKFPNVRYIAYCGMLGYKDEIEYKNFKEWCLKKYQVFEVDESKYDVLISKYI